MHKIPRIGGAGKAQTRRQKAGKIIHYPELAKGCADTAQRATGPGAVLTITMKSVSSVKVHAYKDCHMDSGDVHGIGPGSAVVFSARSPEKTAGNQDSAGVIQLDSDTAVLMVADGVGGLPGGGQASALLIDILLDAAAASGTNGIELRHGLLSAIEEANQRIINNGSGAATTLAMVEIRGRGVRPYHVGDSMIMAVGQRGKVKMETISHSPVGYAVEAGVLSEEEAIVHDDRHLVSNVVGSQDMHISMGIPLTLAARDTLLIATDGLFDNVPRDAIIDMIRTGPLPDCARRLAERAGKHMNGSLAPFKPDDLTFILYRPSITARGKKTGSRPG
jgi:serine/threonine protein phosphatase PrpC